MQHHVRMEEQTHVHYLISINWLFTDTLKRVSQVQKVKKWLWQALNRLLIQHQVFIPSDSLRTEKRSTMLKLKRQGYVCACFVFEVQYQYPVSTITDVCFTTWQSAQFFLSLDNFNLVYCCHKLFWNMAMHGVKLNHPFWECSAEIKLGFICRVREQSGSLSLMGATKKEMGNNWNHKPITMQIVRCISCDPDN